MSQQNFKYDKEYKLESGEKLNGFSLAYHTYGKLNKEKNNVIWICHALTANSDAQDWWPGLIGKDQLFDPAKYFIVCANIPGSSYGSTGPLSENPVTDKPFYHDFPFFTVRDIVGTLDLLRKYLGIEEIHTAMGGSLGGQQALEWSIIHPEVIKHLIVVASNAVSSPWGIAFRESQRAAIEADVTWKKSTADAGIEGLKVARGIALLSYRNYLTYLQAQKEETDEKVDDFKASSYQRYQGEKLAKRFNAYSYWTLSKTMDSHNIGRGRGGAIKALSLIKAKVLTIGISSDILFPAVESKFIAQNVSEGTYEEINSLYGHDGFLIEVPKLTYVIQRFYQKIMKTPKIGLFGLGCVGQGFYELSLLQTPTATPSKIVVKDALKKRNAESNLLSFDRDEVLNDDSTNLVVEVIDNSKDAIEIVRGALKNGKNVVTANKKMIVENFPELLELQEKTGAGLLYEAGVCASIPILRTIDSYFSQEPISSIRGLCNGTSNYILSAVYNRGWEYSVALAESQRLGFAESDPTLDVESYDALFKLVILTLHGFGVLLKPQDVFNYGISNIHPSDIKFAKAADYKIRQVAQAYKTEEGKISLWVTPQFVSPSDPLYHVENEFNGITIEAEHSGTQFFSGRGAGSYPTGAAVLSDVHASLAGYKYKYEKYKSNNGLTISNSTEIEVYLRTPNENILEQIPLKNAEKHGRNFATGKLTLAQLIKLKPLLEKEKVFLATLPFSTNPNKNATKELLDAQLQKEALHLKN
jgi:homoserine O-acetyltransferase